MKYSVLENAIVEELRSHFNFEHRDQVVAGDIDKLLPQMIGEGKKYGCLVEFGGGARRGRSDEEPFKATVWQWSVICVFMIRYTGEVSGIEDDLRSIIDRLSSLFEQDHTLGKLTPWIRLERIDQAEIVKMNDIPMYWLPFEIMVFERS